MDAELEKKVDRALALSQENNRILKTLLRNMRWGRFFRVIYWAIIIAASIGIFIHFEPVLDNAIKTFGSFENGVKNVNGYLSK